MNPIVEKILDRADDYRCADYEDRWEKRQALRAAIEQALSARVPDGWKLVPVEPTPEMKTAGIAVEVYPESKPEIGALTWAEVKAIYSAMLAAAPRRHRPAEAGVGGNGLLAGARRNTRSARHDPADA